jgi:hypothetical protein
MGIALLKGFSDRTKSHANQIETTFGKVLGHVSKLNEPLSRRIIRIRLVIPLN